MTAPGRDPATPLVLFDLDDTLSDRAAGFRAWAERFIAFRHLSGSSGAPADPLEWMIAHDDGGYTPRDLFFRQVIEEFGLTVEPHVLVEEYIATAHESYHHEPALCASLEHLIDRGIRVAVVTNGGAGQDEKIDAIGIRPLLSGRVVSGTVGIRKPDPRIFALAVEAAGGVVGRRPWMVGDHPANDIGGGSGAGLFTMWISLGRSWPDGVAPPTTTCNTINDAFAALPHLVDA